MNELIRLFLSIIILLLMSFFGCAVQELDRPFFYFVPAFIVMIIGAGILLIGFIWMSIFV